MFWKSIEDSTDAAMFEAYLEQYPSGAFAALARAKAAKFKKEQQVASLPPSSPTTGATKAQVQEAQRMLKALDYDPGPADGAMSGATKRIIESFQLNQSLLVDGYVTESLLASLKEALERLAAVRDHEVTNSQSFTNPATQVSSILPNGTPKQQYDFAFGLLR